MSIEARQLGEQVDYHEALQLQNQYLQQVLTKDQPEAVFYLEHSPVYTIGRTRDQSSLGATAHLPYPVIETNRGGQATYHGPGQLVGYPIIDLRERGKDLHAHVRSIELALIATCSDFGVNAKQREGLTGVWVEERKIASIGVGVRKWISMHGFAINITQESLTGFQNITPCGLQGVGVTDLSSEANQQISISEFSKLCHNHLQQAFDSTSHSA